MITFFLLFPWNKTTKKLYLEQENQTELEDIGRDIERLLTGFISFSNQRVLKVSGSFYCNYVIKNILNGQAMKMKATIA
jgi:hypothetical protein